jgi:para-nitrobenzyl esterase
VSSGADVNDASERGAAGVEATVVVETAQGRVRGSHVDGVVAVKGIPYAAPPFGVSRFRAPAPAQRWDGVRDATAFGPTAPATGYPPPFQAMFDDPVIAGEDCLSLNVWTPDPGAGGLPVLVWIHGGAFRNGTSAAPLYDGAHLAREGVVLVSLNYRLGTDGFLLLDGVEPNRGLLDQVAALEWVQEHVAAFGGDPGNVTVFGESAGSISLCSLLAMPRARGLFHRAIAQSGGGHHALPPEDARRVTEAMAGALGVPSTPDGFASVRLDRLAEAQAAIGLEVSTNPDPARWGRLAFDGMPFEPTVDGDVLPALPIDAIADGAGAGVPLLTGTTAEEWRLFLVPTGMIDLLTDAHVAGALAGYGAADPEVAACYAELGGGPGDRLSAVVTDWFLRIPAIRLAEARADGIAPTYLYELAWRSPQFGGRLGACHGLDLPFVFGTLGSRSGRAFAGDTPPQSLSDEMRAAWLAFARTGDPGWPPYEPGRRSVMVFDEHPEVVDDPQPARRTAWDGRR